MSETGTAAGTTDRTFECSDYFATYLCNESVWSGLWPILVLVLAASTLLIVGLTRKKDGEQSDSFGTVAFTILAFCALGATTGVLSGFSRESVLGGVLPAVLSLVAGVAVYLVARKAPDGAEINRNLVAGAITGLALTLLVGSFWGAVLRSDSERYEASFAAQVESAAATVCLELVGKAIEAGEWTKDSAFKLDSPVGKCISVFTSTENGAQPMTKSRIRLFQVGSKTAPSDFMSSAVTVPAAVPALAPSSEVMVFFDHNSSELNGDALTVLKEQVMPQYSMGDSIHLVGHDDKSGTKQEAFENGTKRAQSVASKLIDLGVPESAISTSSHGSEKLMVETPDGMPDPQNRRVIIEILR